MTTATPLGMPNTIAGLTRRTPLENLGRRTAASDGGRPVLALLLGVLVVVTWVVLVVLHPSMSKHAHRLDLLALGRFLNATSAVVALLVGSLCILRWRLLAERADLHLGLGVLAFGGVRLGLAEVVEPLLGAPSATATVVPAVASLGFVMTVGFLLGPLVDQDTAGRTVRRLTIATAAGAVLMATVPALPIIGDTLVGRGDAPAAGHVVMALAWATLGLLYADRARTGGRPLDAWVAFMLFVLCQGRVAFALTATDDAAGLLAGQVLRLEALLVVLVGVHREFRRGLLQQHTELVEVVRALDEDRQVERAARQERDHDLRSALFAIGGTARNLERYHDRIEPGSLEALAHALSAEASRLHRMVSERPREDVVAFDLGDAIRPLVVAERYDGRRIELRSMPALVVAGRPGETVEVVRNLLDNARQHAPDSPVTVTTEQRDDWVVVAVRDSGPGVPMAERRTIFERGHRGTTAVGDGCGLGLFVARRLMQEQGGDLWVESAPGGGACFVAGLPCSSAGPVRLGAIGTPAEAVDEDDDVEQARRRRGRRGHPAPRRGRQSDDVVDVRARDEAGGHDSHVESGAVGQDDIRAHHHDIEAES